MTYEIRATRLHVIPTGAPIYDERGFTVEIDDEAGGEFLIVGCHDDQCANGQIRLDPSDWPALRDAIERMVNECRDPYAEIGKAKSQG